MSTRWPARSSTALPPSWAGPRQTYAPLISWPSQKDEHPLIAQTHRYPDVTTHELRRETGVSGRPLNGGLPNHLPFRAARCQTACPSLRDRALPLARESTRGWLTNSISASVSREITHGSIR